MGTQEVAAINYKLLVANICQTHCVCKPRWKSRRHYDGGGGEGGTKSLHTALYKTRVDQDCISYMYIILLKCTF